MNIYKILLLLLFYTYASVALYAQAYLFDVEHINVEEGLPDRRVLNILQDQKGFIWVSTAGAVSRYDGYNFKSYSADFLGIKGNASVKFAVDQQNNLWYQEVRYVKQPTIGIINTAMDTLISIEDYTNGLFSAKDIVVFSADRVNKSIFYIGTKDGAIYKYDKEFVLISQGHSFSEIHFLCEQAADGTYWLLNGEKVIHVTENKTQSFSIPTYPHRVIRTTPSIIIQTENLTNQSIVYLNLVNGQFTPYIPDSYSEDKYYKLLSDHNDFQGHITNDSLRIQYQSYSATFSIKDIFTPCTNCKIIPEKEIVDAQNNFWMATENGIIKISLNKNPFTTLEKGNSLRGIYKKENHLWLGGYIRNARYNLSTNEVEPFMERPTLAAFSFDEDEQEHLWVVGGNVLFEYSKEFEPTIYPSTYRGLTVVFKNKITNSILIGTERTLLNFDKKIMLMRPVASFPNQEIWVRQIYQNDKGIWVVTNNGIFLLNSKTETLIHHYTTEDGLPTNNINHLYEDEAETFWIATKNNGLVHWDMAQNNITQYTTANGLSNNTLYAVYEDDFNNLWLPSNYGLMCFDKQTLSTRVYLPKQGIAHEEFNTYSHFRAADGTLYFGGLNGVTQFHPKDIFQQNDSLPLYVTKVNILTSGAEYFDDKTADFKESEHIILQPNDRILEVSFSLLDYGQSSLNQYAYKIEGYQNQWVYTKDNKISLINMPYGDYNLVIKARGAKGNWSARELSIPLEIQIPFYKKWWFLGVILFGGVMGIATMTNWRINKLEKDRKQLKAEVKKRTQELERDKETITKQAEKLKQLDETKTRFFSNITHEFRTPLTLIIGPTEQLLKDPNQKNRRKLYGVLKNAKQLLGLINQLLDLSKLESGGMKLAFFRGDIVAYTKELVDRLRPMANNNQQRLALISNQQEWETYFDKEKWDKIIYNLVSNAIKFTPREGAIQISLLKAKKGDTELIRLEVKDSGIGIKDSQIGQVFNRFYQTDGSSTREQEGTGIGLSLVKELVELQNGEISVISKVGKGTSFRLEIPVPVISTSTVEINEQLASRMTMHPIIEFESSPSIVASSPFSNQTDAERLEILIIEDNDDMRAYIRSCIDEKIYHVSEASNGEAGIEQALAMIPDLIISDVMMPKKDGFEVTQTLRSNLNTSHIPIVLLTAKASLENRLEGLRRGADAYLSKPFSPDELLLRIQKLIELRKLLQLRYTRQLDKHSQKKDAQYEKEDAFVKELKDYVLENINNTLNGDIVGKQFGMSRMQLHRKLKALTNQSISEFIKTVRLERALELLAEKQLNISEISYTTGFSSPNHFSRVFKEKFGKKPSEV